MTSRAGKPLPSPDRWRRLQQLFADAVALGDSQQSELVLEITAEDTALGEELRSLLAHHEEDLPPLAPIDAPAMPARLGPYRLLEELGRGGMGTVYLAERADGEFEGRVAIKVVRSDLGGAEARRRFLRERQLLADLDHPQIATLLDAGSSAVGEPWLAMDYVEGVPIDQFCQVNGLSLAARIELFRKVCDAVHFAHQSLVVHRDLKPSNILVRADGSPQLLDFGIAKLVDEEADDAGLTHLGASPRTPEYASPEQVSSRPITTATDIYALGTILYEMWVGERPYTGKGPELERRICEQEPIAPSARLAKLQSIAGTESTAAITPRQLRGDLDEIVLRALRKEPSQRYASAAELSEDLANYRQGLPVKARRGAALYRTFKFIRRHRAGVAAAVLIFALLSAFVLSRLNQSRQLARESEKVQAMNSFLQEILGSADPYEGLGRGVSITEALQAAVGRIDVSFAGQPELAANAQHTIGTIFMRLGNYWQAEPLLTTALATRQQLHPGPSLEVVETANRLGQLLVKLGRTEEAEPVVAQALEMLDQLPQKEPRNLTESLSTRAWMEQFQGNHETAERIYRRVLDIRRGQLGPEDPAVAVALNDLGSVISDLGRFEEAQDLYNEALDLRRRVLGDDHPMVAESLNDLGLLYEEQGDWLRAETLYGETLTLQRETLGDRHPAVAQTLNNLAGLLNEQGKYDAARERFTESLAIRRQVLGGDHPDVGTCLDALGTVLAEQGDYQAAEEYLIQALSVFEQSVGPEHVETAKALNNMGFVKIQSGSYAEAAPFLERALAIFRQKWGHDHPQVATSSSNLATVRFRLGEVQAAADALREVLRVERNIYGGNHKDVATSLINLGTVLGDLGEYQEAEDLLLEALATLGRIQEEESPLKAPALNSLAGIYEETERWQEARETYRQAIAAERRLSGEDHPNVAIDLSNLAGLVAKSGEAEEAEALYREAARIFEANPDFNGPQPAVLHKRLGEVVCGLEGRGDEGIELFRSARVAAVEVLGADHWIVGEIDSAYGGCLAGLGDNTAAEPLLRMGWQQIKDILGEEHPQTKKAAERLDQFEVRQAKHDDESSEG